MSYELAPTRLSRLRAWIGVLAYVWLLIGPGLSASPAARLVQVLATLLVVSRLAWLRRLTMYRLRISHEGLEERRWPGRWTFLPHAGLVGFVERAKVSLGVADGFEFAFRSGDGREVTLTTDVPGWARCIQTVHRIRPNIVPHPKRLAARRVMLTEGFEEFAETIRSPGQDIPEEWAWARRPRRRDLLIGLGATYALLLPAARWLRAWATDALDVDDGLIVLSVFLLHFLLAYGGGVANQVRARTKRVTQLNVENFIRRVEDLEEPPVSRG